MLVYLQNVILEMIARGAELRDTADRLCREIEAILPGVICSILGVDDHGVLNTIAAPSLSAAFCDAIDGVRIGPAVGSCGTAAYRRQQVSVEDIATSPLWTGYKDAALAEGLNGCWSSPVIGSSGNAIATFAFYFHEARGPTAFECEIVDNCLKLCTIAFERDARLRLNQRLLFRDPLTGLSNRAAFEAAFVDPAAITGAALLLIDIDDLKIVNDTFGHHTGDSLIRQISQRLAALVGEKRAFRIGGDELAVLVPEGEADGLARDLLARLQQPADIDGQTILPSVTVGMALRRTADEDGRILRQDADLALYHGKDGGGGRVVVYAPELRLRMNQRRQAVAALRAALADGRLEAHYQPIFRLDTGAIERAEALVRIRDRDGCLLSAGNFHEGFDDARNAVETTGYMLRRVAADLQAWRAADIPVRPVAVNLTTADFAHGRLVEEVAAIFAGHDVPLAFLTLEITETVYLGRRDRGLQDQLDALRALGVKLALDDFGTGYASLTHLLSTPVDVLKIDKSFVDHLASAQAQGGAAVINGLMRMSEKLAIDVVAEGVETETQRQQLMTLGCQLGQGHLFGKAVPADELSRLLLAHGGPVEQVVKLRERPHWLTPRQLRRPGRGGKPQPS
ncbi:EAL domain-containing protein [uncultured Sphingomonas sp.]|uniref:bifunctional diguanylate cyclase/phosphodiesterase n=1 Tax=uncultured Sphingomonas sp. TaxID=158754 RepID=UPI0025D77EDE|nr:EAL domain-containing protein [uncultured Sphingomonas sp.]